MRDGFIDRDCFGTARFPGCVGWGLDPEPDASFNGPPRSTVPNTATRRDFGSGGPAAPLFVPVKKAGGSRPSPGGVTGKTSRVGKDIVQYLDELGKYFGIVLVVTSGYRTADEQAKAMFDNWKKMGYGLKKQRDRKGKEHEVPVYNPKTLPDADRRLLTDYYKKAVEMPGVTAEDRAEAKTEFLKLARERVGTKSTHTLGRAVDIATANVSRAAYEAIRLRFVERKEGRTDIYHFESKNTVAGVDANTRAKWSRSRSKAARWKKTHPASRGGSQHQRDRTRCPVCIEV